MKHRCPCCGQPTEKPVKKVRTCVSCRVPIGSHDKWFFNDNNQCQHRVCAYPTFYTLEDAIRPKEPAPTPLFDGEFHVNA